MQRDAIYVYSLGQAQPDQSGRSGRVIALLMNSTVRIDCGRSEREKEKDRSRSERASETRDEPRPIGLDAIGRAERVLNGMEE